LSGKKTSASDGDEIVVLLQFLHTVNR